MQHATLTQRLQKTRERCLSVPGGIKGVATRMGKVQNTLHNWFRGITEPTVSDVELLVQTVTTMEAERDEAKREEDARLDAILS